MGEVEPVSGVGEVPQCGVFGGAVATEEAHQAEGDEPGVSGLHEDREHPASGRRNREARGAGPPAEKGQAERQDHEEPDRERQPPAPAEPSGPVVELEVERAEAEEDRVVGEHVRDGQGTG